LHDRLRFVLNPAQALVAPGRDGGEPPPMDVEFAAFTEDCRILGRISLDADRLSDMLNGHDEFILRDVLVQSLADGRSARTPEVPVARNELVAVLADRPRGDPMRRTHTLAYPVAVQSGVYLVRGYLHARPGAEPLASARRRRPMIPLTDASIEFALGGVPCYAAAGTIVINRDMSDWIRLVADHELAVSRRAMPVNSRAGLTLPVNDRG
jgi:hypothetical protein